MQRFQRQKYFNVIVRLRRELWGWESTYKTIVDEGEKLHTPRQVDLADRRMYWLEHINSLLEDVEDQLAADADEEGA